MVIGFSNIDTFSHYHVAASDKKAKLQSDAAYVLEHMAKMVGQGIGDVNQEPVDNTSGVSGDAAVKAWTDYNLNGVRDDASDRQVAYRYRGAPDYQVWYYSDYSGSPGSYEIMSSKVSAFTSSYSSANNYAEIQLSVCWDPDGSPSACGSVDNPAISMRNRIYMPAVSTN